MSQGHSGKARFRNLRNQHGFLVDQPTVLARLEAVLNNPTQETWDDCYTLIIGADGWTSLWQSVLAVDPGFPRVLTQSKPESRTESGGNRRGRKRSRGNPIQNGRWDKIPSQLTLLRALDHARNIGIPKPFPGRSPDSGDLGVVLFLNSNSKGVP